MSNEYYFEIRRKSCEFEQNFDCTLKEISDSRSSPEEGALENLLTGYEVVNNEEGLNDGDNEEQEQKFAKNVDFFENPNFVSNSQSRGKLDINLSAEKIALKSRTTKIDKSILRAETEASKLRKQTTTTAYQQQQQKRAQPQQHVPISFTIVPIRLSAAHTSVGSKLAMSKKPTATVTFQATTTTHQQHSNAIPKLPPPPPPALKIVKRKLPISNFQNIPANAEAEAASEVCDKFRDAAAEDNDEMYSTQTGSSTTSPENSMENALSAASSVSVRSSSLSSETTKIKEMPPVNRALNSKSPEVKVSLASPTAITTTIKTTAAGIIPHLANKEQTLKPPFDMGSNPSRSSSPALVQHLSIFPEELKCRICAEIYHDPRTLNCLHSFCFQCIVTDEDPSIQFWSQPDVGDCEVSDWKANKLIANKSNCSIKSSSPETSLRSISDPSTSPSRKSSFSFRRKKSSERTKAKFDGGGCTSPLHSMNFSDEQRARIINCMICGSSTELPIGGIRQLPQNCVLVRKIEELKLKVDEEVISRVWCSLCLDETSATYHCISCVLNLCTLCKDAHERQRTTSNHKIKNIIELRRARKHKKNMLVDNTKFILKCGIHAGFEIKSFCSTCLQIACADCLVLLHKSHKHESINRAILTYSKIMRDSAEQTRPLCNYGEHSIERLNEIAKNINFKCDEIEAEVETFTQQYFDAVEVHRKTLMQQVQRARESKVEMILEQKFDLEKRTQEAIEVIRFSQELSEIASDVEILSFVKILLKRFEFCQQFKTPADPKISDSLHFLPKIRAPSTKNQNDIPLFGIITMQTVEPSLCTLQWEGFSQLRLHKKVELVMLSRDVNGVALCHGGLKINAQLKYKEYNSKFLPVEISDLRDGTYGISLTPDSPGTVLLTVTVNDKSISGSPFTFLARSVCPHSGIYHCCSFCSSKGSKLVKCFCDGRMSGYNGCGHGHAGHPGRRHWSCCGNVLENSECNVANKLLNS